MSEATNESENRLREFGRLMRYDENDAYVAKFLGLTAADAFAVLADLDALRAEGERVREKIRALRDADHYDHWAVRLSDSELTALRALFAILTPPKEEAGA